MISLLSIMSCFSLRLVAAPHTNKLVLIYVIIAIIAIAINQRYLSGSERHPELLSEFSSKGTVIPRAIMLSCGYVLSLLGGYLTHKVWVNNMTE